MLLTAAGVAWGVFETLRQPPPDQASSTAAGPGPVAVPAPPPLPNPPPSTSGVPDQALRIVRLAVSAARADGTVSDEEREAILEQARGAGVDRIVEQELAQPRPLAEIVAGVTDEGQRAALYVLAFGILRGDEQPSGSERIYLAQLAHLLGLAPTTVQLLERNAEQRIDVGGAEQGG